MIATLVEHVHGYKRGDDGGTFMAALIAVKAFGGVLEHPAHSRAWSWHGLPAPTVKFGWTLDVFGGASCFIDQARFGLPMSKPTWLYARGCVLPDLWSGAPHASVAPNGGRRDQWLTATRNGGDVSHLGKRAITPESFRDVLLAMARSVKQPPLDLLGERDNTPLIGNPSLNVGDDLLNADLAVVGQFDVEMNEDRTSHNGLLSVGTSDSAKPAPNVK
jgi:hypothetical protein